MRTKNLKQCKVVMLPTNKESKIRIDNNDKMSYEPHGKSLYCDGLTYIYQNLYFISNDDIKEGDYFLSAFESYVLRNKEGEYAEYGTKDSINRKHKKIYATTDTTLGLPLIPSTFVEAYVEAQGKIDNVQIEMSNDGDFANIEEMLIKLRPDNTCIVHTAKSYSRKELCSCMQYYYEYCTRNPYITSMKWLDNYEHRHSFNL